MRAFPPSFRLASKPLQQDNVLIDGKNRARLADFGFAGIRVPPPGASNSNDIGGTTNYMAPELLISIYRVDNCPSNVPPPKEPVDIYAFGMVIYEVLSLISPKNSTGSIPLQVLSGQRPFHGYNYDPTSLIIDGHRPQRPSWSSIPNHPIWDMAERCWRHDPAGRPKLAEILNFFTSKCTTPPTQWPSPPLTASTPSVAWSSPMVQPTQLVTATIPPVLPPPPPPPPPGMPVAEPRRPSLLLVVSPQRSVPTLVRLICTLHNPPHPPTFRWRVAGGGIAKQQRAVGRRGNP